MKLRSSLAAVSPFMLALAVGCGPTIPPNPCSTGNGGCDPHAFCTTNGAAAECTCMPGFTGSGEVCAPSSPCAEDFGGCDSNASCTADGEFAVCKCNTGFLGDGFHCEVAPTCGANNGGCDPNASCMEVDGMVSCTCNTTYVGNGFTCRTCTATACGANATCAVDETDNRIDCTCDEGFVQEGVGDSNCQPMNNCIVNNGGCDPNATCTPTTDGGMPNCACNAFYTGNGITCAPTEKCSMDNGGCDPRAACTDTPVGPTCVCPTGFTTTNDGVNCTSAFCELQHPCDPHATCADTTSSFTCTCDPGYSGSGTTCTEVNECNPNPCGMNQTCTPNTSGPGTHSCACSTGYQEQPTSDGGMSCQPINLCAATPSPCTAAHETCDYTGPGTYQCACSAGYSMQMTSVDSGESCQPIDACTQATSPCPTNATCTDTGPNTFTCACNTGYESSGNQCVPINHCTASPSPCDANATCNFTGPGTYTCSCNAGFTGDGTSCQSHYIQVSMGDTHICAIRADDPNSLTDGTIWCWGWNNLGQLGNGTTNTVAPVSTPVEVTVGGSSPPVYWSNVAAGTDNTCAIVSSSSANPQMLRNALYCWGTNVDGQIGNGGSMTMTYVTPQQIGKGYTWYSTGTEGYHSCGYGNGGNLYCWGLNQSGQLGLGPGAPTTGSAPTLISGSAAQYGGVTVGTNHTCAVDGVQVQCWGDNTYGQLGLSTSSVASEPQATLIGAATPPSDGSPTGRDAWVAVTAGQFSTCGIQSDESLWCWGANDRGQLGINSLATPQTSPMATLNSSGAYSPWLQVALGSEHACGIEDSGSTPPSGNVFCWGDNTSGQLGIGTYSSYKLSPVAASFPATATANFTSIVSNPGNCPANISSMTIGKCDTGPYGGVYTCAIDTNYELWCWGSPPNANPPVFSFGTAPTLMTR